MGDAAVREWTQLIGSSSSDAVSSAPDGSVYISGLTSEGQTNSNETDIDAFLSKYNRDGSKEWTQLLGTNSNTSAYTASSAVDGSVYITGDTRGNLDGQTNSGETDAFLSEYNSDGSKEWTQLVGSSDWDSANSVSCAAVGRTAY